MNGHELEYCLKRARDEAHKAAARLEWLAVGEFASLRHARVCSGRENHESRTLHEP